MQTLDLPEPGTDEIEQSQMLVEVIKKNIREAGGWIDFERYMQLALYAPGLGYYSGGAQKFGEQGDFMTSPEVSPLFAQSLANPISVLINKIPEVNIIEFGAGSGKLAAELLLSLQKKGSLPEKYLIIELSAELQQRQRDTLYQIAPDLLTHVEWLEKLPESRVNAVVIANEVLDAMPVKRFRLKDKNIESLGVAISPGHEINPDHEVNPGHEINPDHEVNQGVEINNQQLELSYRKADENLTEKIQQLAIKNDENVYNSELNTNIKPWVKSLDQCLDVGAVYLIDYGYPRSEYYSEERHMGSFLGYYRHRSIDAPLWYPGLQDLTAFVDFTEVAEAAIENNFDVDGFTSQGNFLLNAGLAEIVENNSAESEIQRLQIVQQMKTLSLPGEMGERFKVIGLSKGLKENMPGFESRDFRYRL